MEVPMTISSLFRRRVAAFLLPLALVLAGCIRFDYGIALERDLSGTSTMTVEIDPDQAAYVMATMQRMFGGQEGPPSEEELAAAHERVMAQLETQREEFDPEDIRSQVREDLPEGVQLENVSQSADGLSTEVTLRFDHVQRLNEMKISRQEAGAEGAPGAEQAEENPVEPFGGLTIQESGNTLLITSDVINPVDETAESAGPGVQGQMDEMTKALAGAFSGPMVVFSLTAPFEVEEHNATRSEGNTLYWEYDLSTLSSGEGPRSIRVRYRR